MGPLAAACASRADVVTKYSLGTEEYLVTQLLLGLA
jgi:hypothetical protein